MIVVKVELWPMGSEVAAKEIGRTYIANDGAGSRDLGDYKVAVCRRGTTAVPREIYPEDLSKYPPEVVERLGGAPKAARAGEVKDYPRLSYNVWRLVARALLAAFPEEDKPAKNRKPVFDALVAKGVALLVKPLELAMKQINGPVGLPPGETGEALHAVLEWAGAARRDDL